MGFRRLRTPFPLKGKKVFDLLRNYCSTFSGISVRGLADFLFEVGRNMQPGSRYLSVMLCMMAIFIAAMTNNVMSGLKLGCVCFVFL